MKGSNIDNIFMSTRRSEAFSGNTYTRISVIDCNIYIGWK